VDLIYLLENKFDQKRISANPNLNSNLNPNLNPTPNSNSKKQ